MFPNVKFYMEPENSDAQKESSLPREPVGLGELRSISVEQLPSRRSLDVLFQ